MGNSSFFQLIIIGIVFTLIFGDFPKIVNAIKKIFNSPNNRKKNNRKKGS